jgi:hypothetical protein
MIVSVEPRVDNARCWLWQLDKCHDSAGFVTYMR